MTWVRRILALPAAFLLFTLAFLTFAIAEGTRTWEQSKFDDLTKGTPKGIALRSEGGLELAPAFKSLATTPSTYIWSIASDAAGNVYAAAGSPARVYRIAPDGKVTTIFEPQELQVQTLVVGKNGIVYAATAPDGKVYQTRTFERKPSPRPAIEVCAVFSIRARSTSGTSFSTARARSMSPPATTARFSR